MNINPNFIAIDVEYADSEQNICQVGLAIVENLEITSTCMWNIQPPGNIYDENYSRAHHLTEDDTATVGTFDIAWQEIQPVILLSELWAHNADSVEQPVLTKNLRNCGYAYEWMTIHDSRDLYQRPDCPANSGNSLELCCKALGIDFDADQHHGAEYDARKCAEIVIAYAKGRQPDWSNVPKNSEQLRKQQQTKRTLHLGEFANYYASTSSGEEDVFAVLASTYPGAPEQEVDAFDKGDKMPGKNTGRVDFSRLNTAADNPLHGKVVVPTGEFAISRDSLKDALDAMGAKHPTSISGKTYAVIVGTSHVGYTKLIDIEKQERKGHHIFRIVGDDDLNELLYGDGNKFFGAG